MDEPVAVDFEISPTPQEIQKMIEKNELEKKAYEERLARLPPKNEIEIWKVMKRQFLCGCCMCFREVLITDFSQLRNYPFCKECYDDKGLDTLKGNCVQCSVALVPYVDCIIKDEQGFCVGCFDAYQVQYDLDHPH